jgi:TrmH family RNA methyltransferase
VAVLERVEKPGNLGAVLRSADGAGVSALILADPVADPFNPNVVRASLGTVFTVPLAQAPGAEVLGWLRRHGIRIVAARVDAARDHTGTDMRGPLAFVLGSEAEGLSAIWSGEDVSAVHIPMLGMADSLNVSATAAILFYEALRQRGGAARGPG